MESNLKVVRVPITTPTLYPNTESNSYLIGNDKECILIDAGYDQTETKVLLEQAITKHNLAIPRKIILTHGHKDHAPGVKQLTHWSPTVYCHEKERNMIKEAVYPFNQIVPVKDNEAFIIFDTKIFVLHTPGHTKGHLSVYIPSKKVLISGDNIVSEGTTWIGPPDGDMRDYLETLKKLNQLDIERIGPGHGDWVTAPYEKIQFVRKRRIDRENQIINLLKTNNNLSSEEITQLIYQDTIHPSVFGVASRTMEAHLLKLIQDGKVSKQGDRYSIS